MARGGLQLDTYVDVGFRRQQDMTRIDGMTRKVLRMRASLVTWLVLAAAAPVAAGQFGVPSVDYRLGPGDVLSINVSGLREFNQRTRVSNSGRLRVPYVGIMFVVDMTTSELEAEITRRIKAQELVNQPTVRVEVEEHRARPAYVIGEVAAPGQFVITGEVYLMDLLSRAGGLLPSAADSGMLYRRNTGRPSVRARIFTPGEGPPPEAEPAPPVRNEVRTEEVTDVDFESLSDGSRPELNVRLEGGEVLYVPRRREENIYVIGDVNVPGAYILPRRGEITAAQAIIYAGGTLATAANGDTFLMRHDAEGNRQEIPIDFPAIVAGDKPDIPVKKDDIIFVPNSTIKTIGVGLFNMIPRIIQQWLIF